MRNLRRAGAGHSQRRTGGGRRLLALVATALSVALLASGCLSGPAKTDTGGAAEDPQFEGTVEFWTINLKKNYNDYITGLIDAYKKAHPKVSIDWVDVPGQDIATKLLAAVASGDVPDAVNLDSTNLGKFTPALTPMDELLTKDDLAAYQPNLVDSLRVDGKLYAVPWYNGGAPVGIYRKSVVTRAGFDPANPPKNYDDALALAQKVYDTTKTYGMNDLPFYPQLQMQGVKLLNDDKTKAAFNTPAAVAVVDAFKRAYDGHGIAPGSVTKDTRNYPQSLVNGQIAFGGRELPFTLLNIQKNAPAVYSDLVITKGLRNQDGKYLLDAQQSFVVPKASRHKRAAAEFIKFVSNAENQLAFCKLVAIYPSTVESAKDAFFTNIQGNTPTDEARRVIVAELPDLIDGATGTSKDAEINELLADQVRAVMQGQAKTADALATAEKAWNDKLAEK